MAPLRRGVWSGQGALLPARQPSLDGAQARCTERMNLWQSCENSAATLAASSAPRRLATEAASQPVTAALAASSACRALHCPYTCWSWGIILLGGLAAHNSRKVMTNTMQLIQSVCLIGDWVLPCTALCAQGSWWTNSVWL